MITVNISRERCKGCGRCVNFCKRDVLLMTSELNSKGYHPAKVIAVDKCNACMDCTRMCPDICISIYQ